MPDPKDLRVQADGGTTYVMAGPVVLACYRDGDLAMRNIAVAVARQLGFPGKVVAEVMGLTPSYVATLHQRALRNRWVVRLSSLVSYQHLIPLEANAHW